MARDSDIGVNELAAAERLAALDFSDEERKLALRGLRFQLAMYERRRAVELPGLGLFGL